MTSKVGLVAVRHAGQFPIGPHLARARSELSLRDARLQANGLYLYGRIQKCIQPSLLARARLDENIILFFLIFL